MPHAKTIDVTTKRVLDSLADLLEGLASSRDRFATLDREAAAHVESMVVMWDRFTGKPPYVGWKGIGLAIKEEIGELRADRDRIAGENARLRVALEAIDALDPMEINPSNYDHDDACELSRNAAQASVIAREALGEA